MVDEASQNEEGEILVVEGIKVAENEEFIHFATKGWETQLVIGIDFTSSNIDQTKPESLHYLGVNNQYEQVIKGVGTIL